MKRSLVCTLILIIVAVTAGISQDQPVKITSERNENILKLYAENSGDQAYKIELNIKSTGFKHTRECPIVETVKANGKIYLTSLIAKKDEEANYSISLKYSPTHPKGGNKTRKIASEASNVDLSSGVFVFSKEGCGRCRSVEKFMKENDVRYTKLNITKDANDASLMWQQLGKAGFTGKSVQTPVIVVDGEVHFNLKDYNNLLRQIANNSKK